MQRLFRTLAFGTVLAIGAAACGGGDGNDASFAGPTDSATTSPTGAMGEMEMGSTASIDTGAASIRTGLSNLLQEHVYLAGIATGTAIGDGPDSEAFAEAAATLDANSVALSEAVASVYGEEGGAAFLELWRAHIGMFVDYTVGAATDNEQMRRAALADLDGYRRDFGAFIESATEGGLSKDAVASELEMHVDSLTAAIDAQAAGDPQAYQLLREAASHMPMTANVLAGAIVTQFPDEFDGAVDAPAAELRVGLNTLLQEHVYLAGIATGTGLTAGPESKRFAAAAETLDANSVALSEAVASVYGEDGGVAFLELWRAHIVMFVDYTLAVAGGDEQEKERALAELDGYRDDFGAFIESATEGGLSKDAVAAELEMHVDSLTAAIDAQAAGDAQAFTLLREAASHMPMTADVLAGAIVTQFPEDFAA